MTNELQCAYCDSCAGPFHRDHVVPRSRGGPDTPANLVMACQVCNFAKRDLLPSEWRQDLPGRILRIEREVSAKVAGGIRARRDCKGRKPVRVPRRDFSCYYCGGPIDAKASPGQRRFGFIEIFDQEAGPPFLRPTHTRFDEDGGRHERGSLAWPGTGSHKVNAGIWFNYQRIVIFTHQDCGPDDDGYWIPFDRLNEDWEAHIAQKNWCVWEIGDALRAARKAAGVERIPASWA